MNIKDQQEEKVGLRGQPRSSDLQIKGVPEREDRKLKERKLRIIHKSGLRLKGPRHPAQGWEHASSTDGSECGAQEIAA